nr:MAG TPA: hypothetical protein [Caudoviricetes sp.]
MEAHGADRRRAGPRSPRRLRPRRTPLGAGRIHRRDPWRDPAGPHDPGPGPAGPPSGNGDR